MPTRLRSLAGPRAAAMARACAGHAVRPKPFDAAGRRGPDVGAEARHQCMHARLRCVDARPGHVPAMRRAAGVAWGVARKPAWILALPARGRSWHIDCFGWNDLYTSEDPRHECPQCHRSNARMD